ncbi:MotA/TolQ/ExbB proton channel [Acidimicrobium ferrooxidans DSM 10331]|uniref:MotA/TolQ/ExbB proton channel n=1 Tax=Acidimicrobium ferrooxidans (strain DSM 10331 / JCM 15462 / NBRC 103882 / ICP) TaxID=525909 RepID=C7M218_ACIFD|nr:motility protein A [Acidimicrobium ferrooxidans]ACU53116.1 MotA/TolQ/ExbB proton channel [Acidimicrobium ferrooxidans DSM 10331]
MDVATPVGIVVALVAILVSMIMDGGNPAALIAPSAMILVLVGTVGVSLAGRRLKEIGQIVGALRSAILAKAPSAEESVGQLVHFAEMARREGVLALEAAAKDLTDPFMRSGMQLIIDGVEGDKIREILEADLEGMGTRHRAGAKFFKDMAGFAPTLGILGTVMGLIHVLANLSSPQTLGPAISGAFTATLWGVMTANVFWLPISNKLAHLSEQENALRLLVIDGILAIQAGASPRLLEQQLLSFLAPTAREAHRTAKERAKPQKKAA